MIKDGFSINECDKYVYTKTTENAYVTIFLYIDDMLILETNTEVIKFTKKTLSNNFDMSDLGVADVILGIKITRILDGISLSQSHYIDKMIKRFKEHEIKENTNHFLSHIHIRKNTRTEKATVGGNSLMWKERRGSILKSAV